MRNYTHDQKKFDNRLNAIARKLDDITIRRANFAEFLLLHTERIGALSITEKTGKSKPKERKEAISAAVGGLYERVEKLSNLGDSAAEECLELMAGGTGISIPPIFLKHGFYIDTGLVYHALPPEVRREIQENRYGYGPILGSLKFAGRNYLLGAMLVTESQSNWTMDGRHSVINVTQAVQEAIHGVTLFRFHDISEGVRIIDGKGRAEEEFEYPIGKDEAGVLMSLPLSLSKVEQLIKKATSRRQLIERCLHSLELGFEYRFVEKYKIEDEIDHLHRLLNGILRDELTRAYCRAHGGDQVFTESLFSCGFGEPMRFLQRLGKFLLVVLKSSALEDEDLCGKAENMIAGFGMHFGGRRLKGPEEYVLSLLSASEDGVRERARAIMQQMVEEDRMGQKQYEELEAMDLQEFVSKEQLAAALGAYNYYQEKMLASDN